MKNGSGLIFRYALYSILVICLYNLHDLKNIRLKQPSSNNQAPAMDPSGYYSLTHKDADNNTQNETKDDSKTMPAVLNFFGIPAIIYMLFFFVALKKEQVEISSLRRIILLGISWFIFELTSYSMALLGIMTMGLGIYLFPVIFLISLLVFLLIASFILHVKMPILSKGILTALAIISSILPLLGWHFLDRGLTLMGLFYIILFQLLIGYYFNQAYAAYKLTREEANQVSELSPS